MQQAVWNSIARCQALREDTGPVRFCLVPRADFTEPVTFLTEPHRMHLGSGQSRAFRQRSTWLKRECMRSAGRVLGSSRSRGEAAYSPNTTLGGEGSDSQTQMPGV